MSSYSVFNLDNFKKWMKDHHNEVPSMDKPAANPVVGLHVEPKIGVSRLVSKMEADSTNLEELATDFHENGGTIADVEGKDFVIEVASGNFRINRAYVRKP